MRSKWNYDLTPAMIDTLVVLSSSPGPMPAAHIAGITGRSRIGGKVFAGLKDRGLIQEAGTTYVGKWPNYYTARTWKIRWEGISDPLWGRIMVDHARRHDYNVRDVMDEDDLVRCEIAIA